MTDGLPLAIVGCDVGAPIAGGGRRRPGGARRGEATGEWLRHVEVEQDAVAAGTKVVPVDATAAADAVPLTSRRPPIGPPCCRR